MELIQLNSIQLHLHLLHSTHKATLIQVSEAWLLYSSWMKCLSYNHFQK